MCWSVRRSWAEELRGEVCSGEKALLFSVLSRLHSSPAVPGLAISIWAGRLAVAGCWWHRQLSLSFLPGGCNEWIITMNGSFIIPGWGGQCSPGLLRVSVSQGSGRVWGNQLPGNSGDYQTSCGSISNGKQSSGTQWRLFTLESCDNFLLSGPVGPVGCDDILPAWLIMHTTLISWTEARLPGRDLAQGRPLLQYLWQLQNTALSIVNVC